MNRNTRQLEAGGQVFTIHGVPRKCVVFQNDKHSGTYWDRQEFKSLVSARRAVRFYIARHNLINA